NLVTTVYASMIPPNAYIHLSDDDSSTCIWNDKLIIDLKNSYHVRWMRLGVNYPQHLNNLRICFRNNANKSMKGSTYNKIFSNGQAIDIQLQVTDRIRYIQIEGYRPSQICLLRISGGRNVALKQSTNQSSTINDGVRSLASNAVDGNTNSEYTSGSCSLTDINDRSPTWSLSLPTSRLISRIVLYNRNTDHARLQKYILKLFDENEKEVFSYQDTSTTAQINYTLIPNNIVQAKTLKITATDRSRGLYLSLCEVEIYSDCPMDRWGLECDQECKVCDSICRSDYGACGTLLSGDLLQCTKSCDVGHYGTDCISPCPTNCKTGECDLQSGQCTAGCIPGYVGDHCENDESCKDTTKCEYQCHCDGRCLNSSGLCQSPGKCRKGWFGLRCQYKDLMTLDGAILTGSPRQQLNYINDNNGETCVTSLISVTVTWRTEYHLTWTRLVFRNTIPVIKLNMLYITQQAKTHVPCKHQRLYIVDTKTLDIRCLDYVTTPSMVIEGTLTDLCSMYISGGRNFAYRQEAKLSTTYEAFGGDLAVDGNADSRFSHQSCAHSGADEDSPKLTVTLQKSALIHRVVLYNRDELQYRLRSFYLEIFNNTQQKTFKYQDRSTVDQAVYDVNVNNSLAKQVVVSVKNKAHYDKITFLTICEMEAYGGKWGLTCTNDCPEHCARYCHIDDGSCNVSCVGSNDPPECATECIKGTWGVNCEQNCSNCFNISCDRHTGQCDDGCLGFSDPPVCNKSCISIFFGRNCSEQCPVNCLNKTCHPASGHCYLCIEGYQGNVCSDPCRDGLWGTNCSRNCNNNCHKELCNFQTGVCIEGCKDGYLPPQCNVACLHGTYGRNCSQNCSLRCLNGSCHHVTGYCGGCVDNMYGDFCESVLLPSTVLGVECQILYKSKKGCPLYSTGQRKAVHCIVQVKEYLSTV
ncbi:hypothetical protein Btru_073756, partial [Bulinus truncatus]